MWWCCSLVPKPILSFQCCILKNGRGWYVKSCEACHDVVSFPDPTTRVRKGSGDIWADSWFCKLSNHVTRFVLAHVMVRKTKKTLQCPQILLPLWGWGLGTRLVMTMTRSTILRYPYLLSAINMQYDLTKDRLLFICCSLWAVALTDPVTFDLWGGLDLLSPSRDFTYQALPLYYM